MELSTLKELGLSEGEVKTYSAVLKIGISTINEIHEKTAIERRNIYDILNKLIKKGLISYTIEKGKRTYQCVNPARLVEGIKRKEEKLKNLEKQIPEMIKIYKNSKPKITAEIYRGKEGIKAIFEDMLNYKENYFIGGRWYVTKEMPSYWSHYDKRRIELKVKWYNLVRYELKKIKIPEERLMFVRFLPKEFSGNPSVVFIYGEKVVNVLWGGEFFAFMIESEDIAENYKRYFNYLWDNAPMT